MKRFLCHWYPIVASLLVFHRISSPKRGRRLSIVVRHITNQYEIIMCIGVKILHSTSLFYSTGRLLCCSFGERHLFNWMLITLFFSGLFGHHSSLYPRTEQTHQTLKLFQSNTSETGMTNANCFKYQSVVIPPIARQHSSRRWPAMVRRHNYAMPK